MALSRAVSKNLIQPRCLLLQTRLCSHGRSKGEATFGESHNRLAPSSKRQMKSTEQAPQAFVHFPVISGSEVSFPVLPNQFWDGTTSHEEDMTESLLKQFEVSRSPESTLRILGDTDLSMVEDASEELLKSFEVPGSLATAAKLLLHVDVKLMLSRSQAAQSAVESLPVQKKKSFVMPKIADRMVTTFGGEENTVALVCRFARVASDIAGAETHEQKVDIVCSAVQDICGSQALGSDEIDEIVGAVSEAQQQGRYQQERSHTATNVIRHLSFENVWQKLNEVQRQLVTVGCQSGNLTSDGLVKGLQAFEESWRRLSNTQHETAKNNLRSLAEYDVASLKQHYSKSLNKHMHVVPNTPDISKPSVGLLLALARHSSHRTE